MLPSPSEIIFMPTIHVVGAGISGLAAAIRAARSGFRTIVYEAAGHAGGRARSLYDEKLGCVVDNGNHLLLGANKSTMTYLSEIKAEDPIKEIRPAVFPFLDVKTGECWRIQPGRAIPPTWLFCRSRRVPNTRALEYFNQTNKLRVSGKLDTVAHAVGPDSELFEKLWQPICKAALNTDAFEASARLLWHVVRETFLKGEKACRPWYFHKGLDLALIKPAVNSLHNQGVQVHFKTRLRLINVDFKRVTALSFSKGTVAIEKDDAVILALPPDACNQIWPTAGAPAEARTILNAHFLLDKPIKLPWNLPFIGLINTEAQWVFVRDNILSLTVSAANDFANCPNQEIAGKLWKEVGMAIKHAPIDLPPWRIIKERRGTFAQTPAQTNERVPTLTSLRNLFLAGDWTDTGMPATIDGSITSGFMASEKAKAVIRSGMRVVS